MTLILSPSMMCANFNNLKDEVKKLDESDINIYHMDIMDGRYVPNFALGPEDYMAIRKLTKKPMDAHLMIENPRRYINYFAKLGTNLVYFCPDAEIQPARTIDDIHEAGMKAGIAINTGTSYETVKELLPMVDYVLVMTVHPGFAGQPFQENVIPKLEKFCGMKERYNYILGIDGAVSRDRIKSLYKKGVDNFILGTSALFNKNQDYQDIISSIRKENG